MDMIKTAIVGEPSVMEIIQFIKINSIQTVN